MYSQNTRTPYCKKVVQICKNYKRANKAINYFQDYVNGEERDALWKFYTEMVNILKSNKNYENCVFFVTGYYDT